MEARISLAPCRSLVPRSHFCVALGRGQGDRRIDEAEAALRYVSDTVSIGLNPRRAATVDDYYKGTCRAARLRLRMRPNFCSDRLTIGSMVCMDKC